MSSNLPSTQADEISDLELDLPLDRQKAIVATSVQQARENLPDETNREALRALAIAIATGIYVAIVGKATK